MLFFGGVWGSLGVGFLGDFFFLGGGVLGLGIFGCRV